jgi:hypothetical protein
MPLRVVGNQGTDTLTVQHVAADAKRREMKVKGA